MTAERQTRGWKGRSRPRIPRYRVHLPLDVTVLRSGIPDKVPGRSINLSEGGVGAVLAAEIATGESVGVELQMPEQARPLRWRAVVRYQDKLRCGMEFSGLSAEQRAQIRSCTEKLGALPEPVHEGFRPLETLAEALADYAKDDINADKAVKGEPADAGTNSRTEIPEGRGARRTFLLLAFLLTTCSILLAVFWLRWNQGWEELESGLSPARRVVVESPQLQVPAADMEKLVIHRVDPDYPAEARRAKLQTVIALDVIVGKDGSVVSIHPLNGPPVLARSAMNALRWWRFEPYRVDGKPATVETTLAVEFKP